MIPRLFVDAGVLGETATQVRKAAELTEEFCTLARMQVNAIRLCHLITGAVRVALDFRDLGAHLTTGRALRSRSTVVERLGRGAEVARLVAQLPLGFRARAVLLGSLVMPMALYGSGVGRMSESTLRPLRVAVSRAVRSGWKCGSPDLVLTVLVKGHLVDPIQAHAATVLRALRRQLQARPDLQPAESCR